MSDSPSKRHRLRNTLIAVGAVVLLIAAPVGVYAFSLSHTFDSKKETIKDPFPDEASRPAIPEGAAGKAENILLLGSDTRGSLDEDLADIRGQRSDTMLVAHIPADHKHVYVMSIMRDSWVDIPGHGKAKVNAALSYGGIPLVVQTVESLISARIDHVAIVDFNGFEGVTNALGGVDVNNDIGFLSSRLAGHYFPQGMQTMNGTEALAFVGERYAFADGDFQRVRNQQAYLNAVIKKVLSAGTLLDPVKTNNLVSAIAPFMKVDKGFDSSYVASLVLRLSSLRSGDISFFTAPTAGTGTSDDGQSIVNLDQEKMKEVAEAFRTDRLDTYQPEFQTMQ